MKNLRFGLALIILCLTSYGFSSEDKKVYLDPEDILFDSTGIYVEDSNGLTSISTIHHDGRGYWYEPKDNWVCPNCGADNGGGEYGGEVCSRCKWPIYGLKND